MKTKAYAKVNISLDVVGKREDGYHLLEMIMQTIDLYDVIEIDKCEKGINMKCNICYVPTDERNLAYKAAKLFMDKYNINSGVNIKIYKNIPVSAGMAGGSTNAAAVLRLMNKLFNINAPISELRKIALRIGADVPYCIEGGTALCEGIGEKITALNPFKNCIMVIVKPSFGVSTKEVYGDLEINKIYKHPNTYGLIRALERRDVNFIANNMRNVLENVTLNRHKIIRTIKFDMVKNGAMGSLMSGSGPTVFGIFDDMVKAQRCYDAMKLNYKEVFITRTI
ncbi:4-(cytidine 5'-diphospho)-2-C-methyl-D-erythritol kinase [Clostridium hydrogeniformans]|uniref:4-(cytidine 5'-diphospho)-2-C-methyl-D-erythritol kinase n=1 Tax=Clostridium hydrogeniformans TaxID=349933 RepID=UPI000482E8CB|nr:4-(cytidine 5'-diphospho)-2-C-methyl-D-erythritol kinase [Clostridium hydrogeniformans]